MINSILTVNGQDKAIVVIIIHDQREVTAGRESVRVLLCRSTEIYNTEIQFGNYNKV